MENTNVMILKNLNKTILLTTSLILLIGFFGYSQEDKFNSKFKKDFKQLKTKIENLNNKNVKQNIFKENSLRKEVDVRKGEFDEVAVRFQERWLTVTLLA